MEEKEISQAVIARLPRYYRYLKDLKDSGKERISSQELSRIMKVTASQIRQDFNNFGGFGQQGYGYNTKYLYEEIGKILGLDHQHNMVLVGAGNLGQALVRYLKFKKSGFNFICAFDINPELFNQTVGGVPIRPINELHSYVEENEVDIVVLTIPKSEARELAHTLADTKIKAIWNFAHIDLEMPPHIQVESVHLQDSLMRLSYNIHKNQG
ncbi:MAG: redox-sensing transcriptional repressor Rex [Lachnospiraceae bacterium]|nr:redox-sensing transcriptional repressor Rex [Lachnospiraceae bacterium]